MAGWDNLSYEQERAFFGGGGYDWDRPDRVEARGGYHMADSDGSDDCAECAGFGCPECDSEWDDEPVFKQCCGITQRGVRCKITTDDVGSYQQKFRDAAEPLANGEDYCGFHTDQQYDEEEERECFECDGEGCPECCIECFGDGCSACLPEEEDGEVEITGTRSREERDDELRKNAVDVEAAVSEPEPVAQKPIPKAKAKGKAKAKAPVVPPAQGSSVRATRKKRGAAAVETNTNIGGPRRTRSRVATVKKE